LKTVVAPDVGTAVGVEAVVGDAIAVVADGVDDVVVDTGAGVADDGGVADAESVVDDGAGVGVPTSTVTGPVVRRVGARVTGIV
jgi:hypothetical protein